MEELNRALKIKSKYEKQLLGLMNVTGVGVGYKILRGQITDQIAIVVYVKKKLPIEMLHPSQIVPPELEGMPTDVVEAEFVALQDRKSRIRPAVGGISVGHYNVTAGTITNIFYDFNTLKLKLVSNNHVIANSEPLKPANVGDPIFQPGPYDGGTSSDTIAHLERWVKLKNGVKIDGAVGDPVSQEDVSPSHFDFGTISPPVPLPQIGDRILKGGRTTGVTEGIVTAINVTVTVGYGVADVTLNEQIIFQTVDGNPVILGGDSGSLAVKKNTSNPYGVCFAGTIDGRIGVMNNFCNFSALLKVGVPCICEIVVKKPDGEPAYPCVVELPDLNLILTTDENGKVLIGNLIEGSLKIRVIAPPFKSIEETVPIRFPKSTVEVTLEEKPAEPLPLSQQMFNMLLPLVGLSSTMVIVNTLLKPEIKEAYLELREVVE